ncbi:MAG TPA: oxidoreductase [Dehalococcoidia bacterium]|nr:oxidoreductase [Dehalococcoidia bacterium]
MATSRSRDGGAEWQIATVSSVDDESTRVKLFTLDLPDERAKAGFFAGQYYDLRLTAPDGYQAQRSYSITSSPDDPGSIELAIELITDGEVSSYFHEFVEVGDKIELRGPIGGHFTWLPMITKPVLFIAGGSGIAPIMSMLRHHASSNSTAPALLMFSARNEPDILYKDELERMADADQNLALILTLTRGVPDDWRGESRRIDKAMVDQSISQLVGENNLPDRAYVCGGSSFVESIGNYLLDVGMGHNDVRTERFGP